MQLQKLKVILIYRKYKKIKIKLHLPDESFQIQYNLFKIFFDKIRKR